MSNSIEIKKVLQVNLPESTDTENLFFTEDGGIYITSMDGNLVKCGADKPKTIEITLSVADWEDNKQTQVVNDINAGDTIIVSPTPASLEKYGEFGVYASEQGNGTITFSCKTVPAEKLIAQVVKL